MSDAIKPLISTFLFTVLAVFSQAETQYPLTVTDDQGNRITLTTQPAKISSKTLFTDELLLNLVAPEQLSSITHIATDETFSNIADKVPPAVQQLDLNVEAILANAPDILFAANWSESDKIRQLRAVGVPVYLINTPFTLADIQQKIRTLGELLNLADEADALIEQMNLELASLAPLKEQILQQGWVALDYNSWGTANGKNTTWQAVLDNSGLINGAAGFEAGAFGQVALSKELIVAVNPDVLFLPGWIYGEHNSAQAFYDQVVNDPALASVPAIRHGRVYPVPENLRGTYSQYLVQTIRFVTETVYQDIAH
ncbi:ABC transporter substrate-binding protein [Reinekea marinisedimentorum]|uniref:Iron complex transport system substrate-binding protein n=1 Tax=Reinekea marinisedimentorum TaxID=230495 RepID=A0A4R3IB93_9GAMM|nr:ABC transporter substrate-binding protein [Reinekea marinisedimentorum]TCS43254.1 iron complex transport system substrate-binding protein [Reinekea marinisedimentorum]